jgi:hypothetical protein
MVGMAVVQDYTPLLVSTSRRLIMKTETRGCASVMSMAPIVSMILFNSYDADGMDGNVSTSDNSNLPNSILHSVQSATWIVFLVLTLDDTDTTDGMPPRRAR